jgi:hypothetical protein
MIWFVIALALLVWFVGADQLTRSGFYQEHVVWMRPVGWLAGVLWLAVLLRSKRMALVLVATPAWWLVAVQVYRPLGGAVLLMAWALGRAPAAIALPAGIGDGLVGLLALPVAVYLCSGRRGGATIAIAWNVLGLADFAIGFCIGTFVPFGLVYPAVMIPAFLAPSLSFSMDCRFATSTVRHEDEPARTFSVGLVRQHRTPRPSPKDAKKVWSTCASHEGVRRSVAWFASLRCQ